MAYTDKQLTCADCGTTFTFTSGEQEHHAKLGFTNEPKRCPPCRAAKKASRGGPGGGGGGFGGSGGGGGRGFGGGGGRGGAGSGPRELHQAVCAECGKTCEVPFKPRGDKPVYCSDCFERRR
jgi:CxxC-x17-CxxC domain-containing protein